MSTLCFSRLCATLALGVLCAGSAAAELAEPASPADPVVPVEPAITAEGPTLLPGLELSRAPVSSFSPWLEGDDPAAAVVAVRALGRLHDPDAVPPLERALNSADPALRAAAAFSLGQYPDTSAPLVAAYAIEDDALVRIALLDAMGRSGDDRVLAPLLTAIPGQDATLAVTAAHALGRLGVRGVLTAPPEPIISTLLEQLGRFDLERRRAAAFALARTKPADLGDPNAEALAVAVKQQPDTIARAWLIRAAATGLDAERWEQVRLLAANDAALGVRIALARGLASRGDANASSHLADLLADPDRPVRVAALESTGRLPWNDTWEQPLQAMLALGDPELLARALPVLAKADKLAESEGWLNPTVDSAVRAAMMVTIDDPAALAGFALDDRAQAVRTSAAEQLVTREPAVERALLWPLLEGPDPVVAGLVASTLAETPDGELIARIQAQLVERIDYDSLVGMMNALATALESSGVEAGGPKPPSLPGSTNRQVALRVAELQGHDDPALRKTARRLGELMGLPAPGPAGFPKLLDTSELEALLGARVTTTKGELALVFHTDAAPYAVQRWVELAEAGFYDGLRFHRIVPDFVVQGGCPRGDGYGGPGYALPDEFSPLPYDAWSVGMASAGPDTAGSQWFVTLSPQPHLDGDYTLFANVTQGQDVLRRLRQDDRVEGVVIERRDAPPTSEHP